MNPHSPAAPQASSTTNRPARSVAAGSVMGPAILLAQENLRTFEWGQAQDPADWLVPAAVWIALALATRWLYRRESAELPRGLGGFLAALRWAAWAGLALVFLEPQWRTARTVTTPSRVVILADTSLSMGLADTVGSAGTPEPSRSEQLTAALSESDFLAQLGDRHDVSISRFGEELEVVAQLRRETAATPRATPVNASELAGDNGQPPAAPPTHWAELLAPTGAETRLGQAVWQTLEDEREAPLAGIVVISDGGQNSGLDVAAAISRAQEAEVPVFAIGLGSPDRPKNVRVRDLAGPARATPGDDFPITGYLQSAGWQGQSVTVELTSWPAGGSQPEPEVEVSQQVVLADDEGLAPFTLSVTPREAGVRTYRARVAAPPGDANPQDDEQQLDVEIVAQPTRVLLVAGGPSREYQFVRNLLHRDPEWEVDVWLQTGSPGIAQEARRILGEFPASRDELWAYDCLLTFDADWRQVPLVALEFLERWVAEQAGGLLLVAGRVNVDRWRDEATLSVVRRLFPWEFAGQLALVDNSLPALLEPGGVQLSRDGREAPFLRLADDADESQTAWARFAGVFDSYPAGPLKAGATLLAERGAADASDEARPLVVEQFYGAGRVLYFGSGEFWRLRRVDEALFERFYTQVARHLAAGRLLRGSSHGVLLIERDRYWLGETAQVTAQLKNSRLEPLELASVKLTVVSPDGQLSDVALATAPGEPGTFRGQLPLRREGGYRLELVVPESESERLVRRLTVQVPDLERARPERDDATLGRLAGDTGGKYYRGWGEALGGGGGTPLVEELADKSKTFVLTGAPEPLWDNAWVLGGLVSVLGLEWLIRRLARLA